MSYWERKSNRFQVGWSTVRECVSLVGGRNGDGGRRTAPDHASFPASSSIASWTLVPTGRSGFHLRSPVTSSSSRLQGSGGSERPEKSTKDRGRSITH